MRALVVTSSDNAEVQEISDPIAAPSQILVDVERVDICGTDVEFYTDEMAYINQGSTHFPLRLGCEWAGCVVVAGPREDHGWIDKQITGEAMLGYGQCEYCQAGHHCVYPTPCQVGIRDGWDGAPAEHTRIPTRFAYAIPENISATSAARVEPGGNSLRAIRAAAIERGQKLLVLGSGTIGLLAAEFAVAEGTQVHVGGVRERSPALARSLGMQHTSRLAAATCLTPSSRRPATRQYARCLCTWRGPPVAPCTRACRQRPVSPTESPRRFRRLDSLEGSVSWHVPTHTRVSFVSALFAWSPKCAPTIPASTPR